MIAIRKILCFNERYKGEDYVKKTTNIIRILILISILMIIIVAVKNNRELETITLYRLDSNSEFMIPIEKALEPDPEAVIKYLVKSNPGYFPKNTKIIDFYIENNRAYVNLNKEYGEAFHGDQLVVANLCSIFYTLTLNELFSIDEVQLLVGGGTDLAPMGTILLKIMTPELRTHLLSLPSIPF